MKETTTIPDRARQMMDFCGFFEVYFEIMAESGLSGYNAYLKTESIYHSYFAQRKYSSYESFKTSRTRYQQKLSNKK